MQLGRRFIITLGVVVSFWLGLLFICSEFITNYDNSKSRDPVELLWWSRHMSWKYDEDRHCGLYTCRITNNRRRLQMSRGILFYGSNMNTGDFPLPRRPQHVWALLHEESPRNVPYMPNNEFLRHFQFTSTFSRYSNFPLTTQYLPSGQALTSRDYFVTYSGKSAWAYRHATSIVFLQSDCDTMTGREDYVKELMKYVEIDSYGACLKNKELPPRQFISILLVCFYYCSLTKDYLNNLYSPELLRFLSTYKFMIAIENAACPDYITEKFWRPLVMGVVPIYFGSPTIQDWQPNNKSAIFVSDFNYPRDLANFLIELADNGKEYDSYRAHKLNFHNPITNIRLLNNLVTRQYHIGDHTPGSSLFEKFECAVCTHVMTTSRKLRANTRHYQCPLQPDYAPREDGEEPDNVADWRSVLKVGRCQARILDEFIRRNYSYHEADFESELNRRVEENDCI
ncbi:hypothetical protein KR009_000342 [Drosophila setifemur]|nr:hypothetical protein KR009_000342 [Drosophila setifemur]